MSCSNVSVLKRFIKYTNLLSIIFVMSFQCSATSIINFNFTNNILSQGFENWQYSDKGSNPCGVYNGKALSKLCSADNFKLYPYYNHYNTDHMGWLRYGYIDADNSIAVSGSSLKITLTGGAYASATGDVAYVGAPIFSQSDVPASGIKPIEQLLPGSLPLYLKGPNSYSTFPQLQGNNRLTVWVYMPKQQASIDYYASSASLRRPKSTFNIYPFINRSTGGHYYHAFSNIPMGGWTKLQFDAHPIHYNGGDKNAYSAYSVGGYEYAGDGVSYFNNITTLSFVAGFSVNQPSPYSYNIDDISSHLRLYENDETINNVGVGYDQQHKRFDISFSDKYRCAQCNAKYLVKYSFSPITLANFNQAYIPAKVINFNRADNNAMGEVIKPNNGYNNLWATIELKPEHLAQLVEGATVYFAIKDISDRSGITQAPIDLVVQNVPSIGNVRTIDLLKTIDYPVHLINFPLKITTSQLEPAVKDHYYSTQIGVSGGVAPYQIVATSPLPKGISLNANGLLFGQPQVTGNFNFTLGLVDSNNQYLIKTLPWAIKSEADFNVNHCLGIVDFGADDSKDKILSNAFSTIIADAYTHSFKVGKTITVGSNGSYDYQGVQGAGLKLKTGDIIRAVWFNNSNNTIVFTPKISFNDSNRVYFDPVGDWLPMTSITIKPNQYQVSEFVITSALAGQKSIININVNYSNQKVLILDKIEYVNPDLPTTNICVMPFAKATNPEHLLVDFQDSNTQSTFGLENWTTLLKDKYTNYFADGLSITIGSNPSYDYQGISGNNGIQKAFNVGDTIVAYWHNVGANTFYFTPNISFNDPDRINMGVIGDWYPMSPVEIPAGAVATSYFSITPAIAGNYSLVNINGNAQQNSTIVLDKITMMNQ